MAEPTLEPSIPVLGEKPPASGIDPFSFFEGRESRVRGLGGQVPSHDPRYVFHSPYVHVGAGKALFSIHFRNLVARRGTLVIYINMLPAGGKSAARLVASQRISLSRLIQVGGGIAIEFQAFRNATFAVLGHITDETDATAEHLDVLIHYPDADSEDADLTESTETTYRAESIRTVPILVDMTAPSLANPVSQICTIEQCNEPVFSEWTKKIGNIGLSKRKNWERAFILQSLRRYGLLSPGARALGLDEHDGSIATALAKHQLSVTITGNENIKESLFPEIELMPSLFSQIPPRLANYDLLWSNGVLQKLGDYRSILSWLASTLRCIRPGGFAVHVTEISRAQIANGLHKDDIERIALFLIGHGHEVARLKFARGQSMPEEKSEHNPVASFGLIVRRAMPGS